MPPELIKTANAVRSYFILFFLLKEEGENSIHVDMIEFLDKALLLEESGGRKRGEYGDVTDELDLVEKENTHSSCHAG